MRPRPPCPLPSGRPAPARPALDPMSPPEPFSDQEARAEAGRCLGLAPCQGCEVCEIICPDQAITRDPLTGRPLIDLAFCKGCGLCAHFCPKGAITMEPEA